jgi:Nucleotide modification associated domain 2
MKLFSYVMVSDSGFAPNPFDYYCTLACCKPVIRRTASVGDWIIGNGSKRTIGNDKLIYAMKITEKLDFDSYYHDERFKNRLDNIYFKNNDVWFQKENKHHDEEDMDHDLSGKYVLVSDHFYNFDKDAISIPERFWEIIKIGPGHKCNFSEDLATEFIAWLETNHNQGKNGNTHNFIDKPENEESCGL